MQAKRINIKQRDKGDILLSVLKYAVIIPFTFLCFYPFYYVLIYSVSDPDLLRTQDVFLWPVGFSLDTYKQLLMRDDLYRAFGVSVARTVLGTLLSVLVTTLMAYLMTKDYMGKKWIGKYVAITMYVSGGMIPNYILLKELGLHNNFLVYIIPGAVNVFNMILAKTFIEQLPESLSESAEIEGAGTLGIFFKIVMPLSKPVIATIALYCAVGQWNSWTDNFFYVRDADLKTLQLILQNYLNSAKAIAENMAMGSAQMAIKPKITPMTVQMTAVVVTMLPIMLVYPFMQKYFAKGIMVGAIKG